MAFALLALGTLVYQQLRQGAADESAREARLALERVTREALAYVEVTESNVDLFASSAAIVDWVSEGEAGWQASAFRPAVEKLFRKLHDSLPDYREIRFLGRDGHEQLRVAEPGLENRSTEERGTPWFDRMSLNWGLAMHTAVIRHPDDGALSLTVAKSLRLPMRNESRRSTNPMLQGYLVVNANLDFLHREIRRPIDGHTARLILLDADGEVLIGPGNAVGNGTGNDIVTIARRAAARLDGGAEDEITLELDGRRSLVRQVPLFGDLRLMALVPEDALEASALLLARNVAAVTVAAIVFTSLLFLALFRTVVLVPIRRLRLGAIAIGEGHLDTPIDVRRDDEIGDLAQAFRDMSSRLAESMRTVQSSHAQIERLAYRDGLTGLFNRRSFLERLGLAIERCDPPRSHVAVLFMDLDDFKRLNDSEGHAAGDRLLCEVADRLRRCVPEREPSGPGSGPGSGSGSPDAVFDCVARLGGDEFVVLLASVADVDAAQAMASSIIDALAEPLVLETRRHAIGGSLGIALYPGDAGEVDGLMACADMAMYAAKQDARRSVSFYDRSMREEIDARLALEGDLRTAIERDELRLQYQPQYRASERSLAGVEALLRWEHPVRGLVAPDHFIPIAEETGLIGAIGEWVMNESCRQWRAWSDLGIAPGCVAVNVSPREFVLDDIAARVASTLRRYRMPAASLEVEVTESCVMEGAAAVIDTLARIRATGVHVAMDDFGTGYSSLGALATLPIDTLKIDRCLVSGLRTGSTGDKIVSAMLGLGASLGLTIVAEGVETEAELEHLERLGCDLVQGYHIGRPMWERDMTALLLSVSGILTRKAG